MSTATTPNTIFPALMREFEDIFNEHAGLVFGTACEVTGNREDGEDVVQTVFLRLLRRGFPQEFQKNPKAYLYRAAVNESLNIIRSRRRHPTQTLEDSDLPADTSETTSHEVIHRKLYEAIAELHPVAAEAVILRYVHDYSDAEIAKLLAQSRVTIAVRLHRARTRLAKLLRASLAEEL
jgi:RNA polymerase sigma-70 factor (ECF subfamily)